jgi:hypothetical protein
MCTGVQSKGVKLKDLRAYVLLSQGKEDMGFKEQ